ncbi:MAG TPA: hypothetical protein VGS07_07340 [Thermoanaerobaculia bacterium]|jgi:hypothetical protein|nr:hypothetical protein [Thermoanaerobaculia bacterium]
MTISFLTLFFGLITGSYPVEIVVNGPAAAVELTVDDRASARLPGPPWKAQINFGHELAPHRIVARALDAEGKELSRTEEWANLPHPLTKVEILLEPVKGSVPRAAKIVWTDLQGEVPESMAMTFDGAPLKLDKSGRAELPVHDLKTIHVLNAEVRFSALRTVHRDLAYGGEYGSEVSTELTGVPLRLRSGRLPPPEKLAGWLTQGGRPLAVAAVEEGPAQLFVVRLPPSDEVAHKMGSRGLKVKSDRYNLQLGRDDQTRFVQPRPQRVEGSGARSDLFDVSPVYTARDGGLPYALRDLGRLKVLWSLTDAPPQEPRIADAVAVAGLAAMTENRRRAVLLLLAGDETRDASRYDADTVRRFLATLRVPLYVWTLSPPAAGSLATAWGPAAEIQTTGGLAAAVEALRRDLDSQRIVMVDGRHLPQSIQLGTAAQNVELVSGGVP